MTAHGVVKHKMTSYVCVSALKDDPAPSMHQWLDFSIRIPGSMGSRSAPTRTPRLCRFSKFIRLLSEVSRDPIFVLNHNLTRSPSARYEQDRMLRVLQHRDRNLAEIQRLASRAADPHHDQVISPEARLSQNGILGCDIDTQGRSDRCPPGWFPRGAGYWSAVSGAVVRHRVRSCP